ncbi:4360_t:CDS:2, partial [Gigaspora rosea]
MEENRDSWDEERSDWAVKARQMDICERLQSIHESNYCHKDFHTGNILCDNRDRDEYVLVWISDFGLCRPVDESPNPVGRISGTTLNKWCTSLLMNKSEFVKDRGKKWKKLLAEKVSTLLQHNLTSQNQIISNEIQSLPEKCQAKNLEIPNEELKITCTFGRSRCRELRQATWGLKGLHEKDVIHRDLHQGNILIHDPNLDPKILTELSKKIANGVREIRVEDTPDRYGYLFEDCWKFDPKNRPNINQVVDTLKEIQIKESEKEFKNVK